MPTVKATRQRKSKLSPEFKTKFVEAFENSLNKQYEVKLSLNEKIRLSQQKSVAKDFASELDKIHLSTPSGGSRLFDLYTLAKQLRAESQLFRSLPRDMENLRNSYSFRKLDYAKERDYLSKKLKGL